MKDSQNNETCAIIKHAGATYVTRVNSFDEPELIAAIMRVTELRCDVITHAGGYPAYTVFNADVGKIEPQQITVQHAYLMPPHPALVTD